MASIIKNEQNRLKIKKAIAKKNFDEQKNKIL